MVRTGMPFDLARKYLAPFTKTACTKPNSIRCTPSKYRSMNGSCNNLFTSVLGASWDCPRKTFTGRLSGWKADPSRRITQLFVTKSTIYQHTVAL